MRILLILIASGCLNACAITTVRDHYRGLNERGKPFCLPKVRAYHDERGYFAGVLCRW